MVKAIISTILTILIYIVLLPLFLLLLIITSLIPPEVDVDLDAYENYRQALTYAVEFMPEIDNLGEYEELSFGYQKTSDFLFVAETMSLTVRYSEEEYASVKEQALVNYAFLDAPVVESDGDVQLDDAFEYKGYSFRAYPTYQQNIRYGASKYFGLLGVNDDLCCIAWLYYDDVDRDYIAESGEDPDEEMRNLIEDEFHWKPFTK